MAKSFKPAELPAEFGASPHEYLKKLNHVRRVRNALGWQSCGIWSVLHQHA